jgi:hypothetical protein
MTSWGLIATTQRRGNGAQRAEAPMTAMTS